MFGSIRCANLEVPEILWKCKKTRRVSAAEIEVSEVQCQALGFTRRQVSAILTGKPASCGARQARKKFSESRSNQNRK